MCARFILFVVGGSACLLIMRYRENSSFSCLLVVHIEVIRRGFAPVFYLSILKGIISSCVVMVLLKCVELKYIAFNSVLYRCRWFSLILSLQCIRKQIRRH